MHGQGIGNLVGDDEVGRLVGTLPAEGRVGQSLPLDLAERRAELVDGVARHSAPDWRRNPSNGSASAPLPGAKLQDLERLRAAERLPDLQRLAAEHPAEGGVSFGTGDEITVRHRSPSGGCSSRTRGGTGPDP